MTLPLVIVHGGAGNWSDERLPIGLDAVRKAAIVGFKTLEETHSALDAAEACTAWMENSGVLNAGRGAKKNLDGIQELDAMIVDGKSLDFGSVAAVTDVVNPISLARYIMEKTDYKFFAGKNAFRVYQTMLSEGYRKEGDKGDLILPHAADTADTVGCIVVDREGNLVATSSTGGITKKMPGRVGDSPVMGAGAYANEIAAASATGWGEHIMRVVLSRMVVLYIEDGSDPMKAAKRGIDMFQEKTGSEAGIIVADSTGRFGLATNAKAMPVVVIQGERDNIHSYTSDP
ncbi:MAG: isoaspartyl peptidase/L-asparaginase family protein [Candidatus Thorarchaeota archaeon]